MLLAALGRDRALVVQPEGPAGKGQLPRDLAGLQVIIHRDDSPASTETQIKSWLDNLRKKLRSHAARIDVMRFKEVTSKLVPADIELVERHVLYRLKRDMDLLAHNEISLTQSEYYSELLREIRSADVTTEITAISTMTAELWNANPEQVKYADENIAAAKRGAKIRRLFVCSDNDWRQLGPRILGQVGSGIEVRRAPLQIFRDVRELEDMVVFSNHGRGTRRGFIANVSRQSRYELDSGTIILDVDKRQATYSAFQRAWDIGDDVATEGLPRKGPAIGSAPPPGLAMDAISLNHQVVTCEQAAEAKGIPLENELKSLILQTSKGLFAAHVRGNRDVSLKAVKRVLEADEAYMAGPEIMESLGLTPGTVSAVLDPVWSLPQLISREVLQLGYVSTNIGRKDAYVRFNPKVLIEADKVQIGDFEARVSSKPHAAVPSA